MTLAYGFDLDAFMFLNAISPLQWAGRPLTTGATTPALVSARGSHLQVSLRQSVITYRFARLHLPVLPVVRSWPTLIAPQSRGEAMKKLIIPTLMDTYGLIKFWDFDAGPGGVSQSARGRVDFSMPADDSMPSERRYKWRPRRLQVRPVKQTMLPIIDVTSRLPLASFDPIPE